MNFFSGCCIFFLIDHLHILFSCRSTHSIDKGKTHFDTYFCSSFSLILSILPRAAALCFRNFLFILLFNLTSWAINFKLSIIKSNYLCYMQKCRISLTRYFVDWCCSFLIQLLLIFIIYIITRWKNNNHSYARFWTSEDPLSELCYYNDKWDRLG